MKILIFGYGNPGRQDDGLGISFADELSRWTAANNIKDIDFETDYQLNLEDSLLAADYDLILFADANAEQNEPFKIAEVVPEAATAFTTHSMTPGTIMALCRELYQKNPKAYILTIRGYSWSVNEPMTSDSGNNLIKAIDYMKSCFLNPDKLHSFQKDPDC